MALDPWHWRRGQAERPRTPVEEPRPHRGRRLGAVVGRVRGGEVLGEQQVSAKNFQVTRAGYTGSWLGLRHHGQGIGTRMRLMALHLAFEGLDAAEMVSESEAYDDNPASNAVSRRLGYTANGSRATAREGLSVIENNYRMTRDLWDARTDERRPEITLEGISSVRQISGIDRSELPEPADR